MIPNFFNKVSEILLGIIDTATDLKKMFRSSLDCYIIEV